MLQIDPVYQELVKQGRGQAVDVADIILLQDLEVSVGRGRSNSSRSVSVLCVNVAGILFTVAK